jgi:dTDP-4-amino-4,6-dideoxygalactose transaminase
MKIPMLDPLKGNASYQQEIEEAALRVIRSGKYIMGLEVEDFEASCRDLLNTTHAIAVSSGTDALLLSMMALGIGPGDEVVCPSFTFFATAGSIARLGAKPVFVDIRSDCFTLDAEKVKEAITDKTKAIIPVHLFGQMADMAELTRVADRHGIPIIEDACQAIGAKYNEIEAGTWGRAGCFSFFPSKNLGGFGDAGLVVTDDDELADKIRMLRIHGSKKQYEHLAIGGNFRIDAIQAAMLNVKIKHLSETQGKRIYHGRYYSYTFNHPSYMREFWAPVEVRGVHTFNQYTLRVLHGRRDELQKYLTNAGISSAIYYPTPLHKQPCFAYLNTPELPQTEILSKQCLSIPVAAELTEAQIMDVVDTLTKYCRIYRD